MYKSKVWIHNNVEDILNNSGHFWIDYTFLDEPKAGEIINISNEMAEDIVDSELWNRKYGPGKYLIQTAAKMFDPKIHDGFSYCIMALKMD